MIPLALRCVVWDSGSVAKMTSVVCDHAGCSEPAAHSLRYTITGSPELEIDLCPEHGAALEAFLTKHGRPPEGKRRYRKYQPQTYRDRT